jgi:hypothetical protein
MKANSAEINRIRMGYGVIVVHVAAFKMLPLTIRISRKAARE